MTVGALGFNAIACGSPLMAWVLVFRFGMTPRAAALAMALRQPRGLGEKGEWSLSASMGCGKVEIVGYEEAILSMMILRKTKPFIPRPRSITLSAQLKLLSEDGLINQRSL